MKTATNYTEIKLIGQHYFIILSNWISVHYDIWSHEWSITVFVFTRYYHQILSNNNEKKTIQIGNLNRISSL